MQPNAMRCGTTISIVFIPLSLFFMLTLNNNIKQNRLDAIQIPNTKDSGYNAIQKDPKFKHIVFLVIMCKGNRTERTMQEATARQIKQASVMFKSAVALTSVPLRFLIFTDVKEIEIQLLEMLDEWPVQYRKKMTFEFVEVWYPPGRSDMKKLGVECAIERLFIPEMLPDEDAVIYADTDLIFMRPPEDLWAQFYKFNSEQAVAMGPCLYYYGTSAKSITPFYGKTGLNAGLILMNLTRTRQFPDGGWLEVNLRAYDRYETEIALADQDILNIVFSQYPEKMYELGCEWNYRPWQCKLGQNYCPITDNEGTSLIHGNTRAFVTDKEPKFKAVFDSWMDYELTTPIRSLYHVIEVNMAKANIQGLNLECGTLENIDDILVKQLKRYLDIYD